MTGDPSTTAFIAAMFLVGATVVLGALTFAVLRAVESVGFYGWERRWQYAACCCFAFGQILFEVGKGLLK